MHGSGSLLTMTTTNLVGNCVERNSQMIQVNGTKNGTPVHRILSNHCFANINNIGTTVTVTSKEVTFKLIAFPEG